MFLIDTIYHLLIYFGACVDNCDMLKLCKFGGVRGEPSSRRSSGEFDLLLTLGIGRGLELDTGGGSRGSRKWSQGLNISGLVSCRKVGGLNNGVWPGRKPGPTGHIGPSGG